MIVEEIGIEKINPAPYNPRKDLKPGDPEYEKLKKSIDEFDLVETLVWNRRSGNLVGGHQRFKVLKARGDKKVPVSVVDLAPEKEKALNIALNKISGDWDIPKLKDLLVELDTGAFDITLTGFDEAELKKLIDWDGKKGITDDDDVPAPPETPTTKPGDVYQLGAHRLMCGDSSSQSDVSKLMNENKADMVFTDPPYGVNYTEKAINILGRKDRAEIEGDSQGKEILETVVFGAFKNIAEFLKTGGSYYICSPQGGELGLMMMMKAGIECRHMIVWKKDSPVFSMGRLDYDYQHEPILYGWRGSHKFVGAGSHRTSIWDIPRPRVSKLHPTMKPVELVANAIQNSSKTEDIILDLFAGSGTSIIASEKNNRRCFSMEKDPVYCDVVVKRWEDFTGNKATLL